MTRPSPHTRLSAAGGIAVVLTAIATATAGSATAAGTLDVATNGNDGNSGTAAAPLKTIQAAIDKATPGTTIRVHAGTYKQELKIKSSGTAAAPITITSAGDGEVKVTSTQPTESCSNRQPSSNRTIWITGGADYWTFKGLSIEHGAFLTGKGSGRTYSWHAGLAKQGIWEPRRKVPGMTKNDPAAAKNAVAYLKTSLGVPGLDPVDHITFENNKMTGRGIYATLANYGVVKNNNIGNIICGTGPGVWVMNFSHFWEVSGNDIHDIAPAVKAHFMHEGIRFGTAASYNKIVGNTVHDLPGDGRAYNTDVDASFNVFERNTARNVAIGLNDQMSGWGNVWQYNTITSYRDYGLGIRLKDATLRQPSMNSSANGIIVRCNKFTGGSGVGLGVGGIMNSKFEGNDFGSVRLGKYVSGYWATSKNTWNGGSQPPPKNPPRASC